MYAFFSGTDIFKFIFSSHLGLSAYSVCQEAPAPAPRPVRAPAEIIIKTS